MSTGIELITKKRLEQIEKHGRTVERDVIENDSYQLMKAIHTMIFYSDIDKESDFYINERIPAGWNKQVWMKMCRKPYDERLAIGGALVAAELDRRNYKKD